MILFIVYYPTGTGKYVLPEATCVMNYRYLNVGLIKYCLCLYALNKKIIIIPPFVSSVYIELYKFKTAFLVNS